MSENFAYINPKSSSKSILENKIIIKHNKKFNEINKIFNLDENYTIIFKNDNIIQFENVDTKEIILECEYNFWGIIKSDYTLVWANSIPLVFKQFKKNTKKLLEKKEIFKKDYEKTSSENIYFYYSILDSNMSLLPGEDYIDKVNNLILYLSDDLFIFNPVNSKNNIQLITIKKILKKYI